MERRGSVPPEGTQRQGESSTVKDDRAGMAARAELKARLLRKFVMGDVDGSNTLTFDEFAALVRSEERGLTHTEAAQVHSDTELRRRFAKLDVDGDGKLDMREFMRFDPLDASAAAARSGSPAPAPSRGAAPPSDVVASRSAAPPPVLQKVQSEEGRRFQEMYASMLGGGHSLSSLFRRHDSNFDGVLDFDEFCRLLTDIEVGVPQTREALRVRFDKLDLNGDGRISFKEFQAMLAAQG